MTLLLLLIGNICLVDDKYRVVLDDIKDKGETDYINASYIDVSI